MPIFNSIIPYHPLLNFSMKTENSYLTYCKTTSIQAVSYSLIMMAP